MKQSKRYQNIILWTLLAAAVAYLGYSIISSLRDPLATVAAVEYEAGAGYYATGFVVRSEQLIDSEYDITVITAAEGQRVAKNQTVATGYLSENAQQRQTRIAELSAQIAQLGYAGDFSQSIQDQAKLDARIAADLSAFSAYLYRRDMNSIADLSAELKGYILCSSSDEAAAETLSEQLERAQSELARLQTAAEEDTKTIGASAAGYFSAAVDGYESVLTPEALLSMTTRDFEAVSAEEKIPNHAGKLITSNRWYYAFLMPADQLSGLQKGDRVKISFARNVYGEIEMRVARVSPNEAGQRLVVLYSDYYLQNVTLLRRQSAEITYASYTGLRVPKSAVRVDENGVSGVFVLEGVNAKWKPITILHDNGESYVVELDRSKTGNLWPGDDIIVGAKGLYDGKVVRES